MSKIILLFSLALFALSTPPVSADNLPGMHKVLNEKAGVFRAMNMKASRNIVNAAQVKVFKEYFDTKDPADRARHKKKIQKISLSIQRRLKVDEMCLISTDGREITRIASGKVSPDSDLDHDESEAPFFKASIKKADKEVHIERPYFSSYTKRWVLAYTSPIITKDGKTPAFLHYEIPLSFFTKKMTEGLNGPDEYVLIVGGDGLLWADSRNEQGLDREASSDTNASNFFPPFDDGSSPGIKKILKAMKKGTAGTDNFTKKGVKYSIVYKPLGYFDWSIAIVNRK